MDSQEDHDLLTKIDTNLTNFMQRFREHEEKDDKRFSWLEKMAYGGIGIVVFVQLVAPFLNNK